MQIIITISLLLVIATVIIYKVNDKFEKREFIILLATIFLLTIAFYIMKINKIIICQICLLKNMSKSTKLQLKV